MCFIDLHVHSSVSDGTYSPAEVTALALNTGLKAYALTDHDSVQGVAEAVRAAAGTRLQVVSGTELSSLYEGTEIHLLGLFIDPEAPCLVQALQTLRQKRQQRNLDMLAHLQRDGFLLTLSDLNHGNENLVITRAHFARALLEKGYVRTMDQAFRSFLSPEKPYFLPKETLSPQEAIRLIRCSGGFPALAHPIQYRLGWKKTETLIRTLTEMGLMGVEVYYSSHRISESARLRDICRFYGLLPTGGSDFHGSNKPDIQLGKGYGSLRVSSLLLSDIEERLARQRSLAES